MARRYASGPSREFAAAWAQLPPWKQQELVRQVQAALRLVKNDGGAVQPVHAPVVTRHAHPHYDGSGGQHAHVHEHGADGTPDADHGHSHAELEEAVASAEAAKRSSRARRRPTVLNSATRARVDDAWARLAADAAAIERSR